MTLAIILAFLKSPFGRWLAAALSCVVLLLAIYGAGHHNGVTSEKSAEASRLAKAKATVAKREDTAKAISTDIAAKTEKARVEIQWRTKTLIESVPRYVQVDPARPSVLVGFVRLHDAAILGLPPAPDAAGRPDSAPSGITDPQLLTVDIANAGACHDKDAVILGWQEFYAKLQEAYDRP